MASSGWTDHAGIVDYWHTIDMFLRPIRLPVLFLVSGMLSSASIMRQGHDTTRKYLIKPLYLYFLWAAVFAAIIPQYPDSGPIDLGIVEQARLVLLVVSPAWYLLALAGYYCVAKLTRDWDLRWLLPLCAAVSVVGTFLEPGFGVQAPRMARSLVFFIAGVRLRDELLAYTAAATPRLLAVTGLFYLGAATISASIDRFLLPVDAMAAAFALQAAGIAATRLPMLHEPARWLGQRTLCVYLLHFPLLVLLSDAVRRNADPRLLDSWLGGMAYPLVATLLIMPASLMLGETMKRCGLGWMFALPKRPAAARAPATV